MGKTGVLCAGMWLVAIAAWANGSLEERANNWHQWRGPEANGSSPNANPPLEWNEGKNVKWKVPIPGRGTSTPIVWGDRIFILTAIKTDRQAEPADEANGAESSSIRPVVFSGEVPTQLAQATQPPAREERPRGRRGGRGGFGRGAPPTNFHQFVVLCLDRKTGKTLWQRTANESVPHEGHHQTGSFAAGSPITDGEYVYCTFGSYGLYCYDMDGNFQWQTDLGDMQTRNAFGEGTSPALHDDTLVVIWDHEGPSFIAALDARTGDEKWRERRDERTTWNTPLITEYDGRTQVITNGATRARSYDLSNGELIWECGGQTDNPIPSPMRLGDLAICLSGFRSYAAYGIPLSATGDITDSDEIAWHYGDGTPYVSSAAIAGDRVFFTKDRKAILTCINGRTGDAIIDQKRLPGINDIYASPVTAAGRVYITGRGGTTVVVDATADDVHVLAENELEDTIDASPALVGNEIFIRGEKSLYCIAEE